MMTVPEPAIVLEAMKVLTSPDQGGTCSKESDLSASCRFDQLLLSNVRLLEEKMSTDQKWASLSLYWRESREMHVAMETSNRWKYVLYCLKLLHILQESLKLALEKFKSEQENSEKQTARAAPPLSPDTLGFGQQKTVLTAVQFIVCLGVCPNLQHGVGLPVELRSEFGKLITISVEDTGVGEAEREWRLFTCVRVLISCLSTTSLSTLILSRHLTDLLAILFQLTRGKKKSQPVVQSSRLTDGSNHIATKENNHSLNQEKIVNKLPDESQSGTSPSVDCDQNSVSPMVKCQTSVEEDDKSQTSSAPNTTSSTSLYSIDIEFCATSLKNLLKRIYPPLLVKSLLLLQGGPGPQQTKGTVLNKKPVLSQAPAWLRQTCGRCLTEVIMGPKGVQSVLRGMLETDSSSGAVNPSAADWRKCDAVAKVIACCPMQSSSVEDYFRKVSIQVLEILHYPDKQIARQFLRVACSTISNMAEQHPRLTEMYVIQPLLKPLLVCTEAEEPMADRPAVVVEEAQLSLCIEDIHKVFVSTSGPMLGLCLTLQPVIHTLFKLYTFTKHGVSHMKTACHEILLCFLKHVDRELSQASLQLIAFGMVIKGHMHNLRMMDLGLMFSHASSGGVMVSVKGFREEVAKTDSNTVECVVDILKDLQTDGTAAEFFLFMLQELTVIISEEVEGDTVHIPRPSEQSGQGDLLKIEHEEQSAKENVYRKLMVLNLLAAMCESLGPSCLKSTQQTLTFVKVTLDRAVQVCQSTEDVMFQAFEGETLTMALGLLTAMLTGAVELSPEDRKLMEELLPLLQEINTRHPDVTVQEMASDLRIAIATHGAVWSDMIKTTAKEFKDSAKKVKESSRAQVSELTKPTIEVLSETSANTEISTKLHNDLGNSEQVLSDSKQQLVGNQPKKELPKQEVGTGSRTEEGVKSDLQQAFAEICDPLLPVRGHGLIALAKLVQRRDKECLDKRDTVLKIFEENLDHPDSYLYLAAVNGLVAMADTYQDVVIPRLAKEFANFDCMKGEKDRSAELRMKLGECLVKASRNLGDMIPKYRDVLLQSALTGARDKDSHVRASSLTNVGEICKLLRFSLGNVVHEVFECCSSLLRSDMEVEVRTAAGAAIYLILQGLGKSSLQVLDSVLRDLYRVLKLTMSVEKDEGVLLHVNLALNELEDIMKDYLFPQQKLEKKIKVLHPD